jgi:hypothetical protein
MANEKKTVACTLERLPASVLMCFSLSDQAQKTDLAGLGSRRCRCAPVMKPVPVNRYHPSQPMAARPKVEHGPYGLRLTVIAQPRA